MIARTRLSVVVSLVVGVVALGGSAVATASGPTASASAASYVYSAVQSPARFGSPVRALVAGHAHVTEALVVYVDSRPCARLFRLEARSPGRFGGRGYVVRGNFRVHLRIHGSPRGTDYVCSYLVRRGGIRTLARSFAAYFVTSSRPSFTG